MFFPPHLTKSGRAPLQSLSTAIMPSTEFASTESSKDIEKKMDTKETIGLDDEQFFDDEAEAIKVTTDHAGEPMRWGKGIVRDFKRTVGTHWFEEMTNFNQKTVAVTVSEFDCAVH